MSLNALKTPIATKYSKTVYKTAQKNGKSKNYNGLYNDVPTVCSCYGRPKVCNLCLCRRPMAASRAGTPGFRPPEVLLKSRKQDTGVDIWACGIIFLCILSRCYPFFRAEDDFHALGELIVIFGTEKLRKLANTLDKNLTVSCDEADEMDLEQLCKDLSNRCKKDEDPENQKNDCDPFPPTAYALLKCLLDVNPLTRISANEALNHPFFNECLNSE